MCNGRLSEFATICAGTVRGDDAIFTGVSTDTRGLQANNLFIALTGPSFDGHDFVDRAIQLGAAGVVISNPEHPNITAQMPCVVVADTRRALGIYAAAWRRRFSIPVAAITGSNGKTSTKEMLAAILRVDHETLATRGNMNNDIGVPLTLMRLKNKHQAAVIELGSNAAGEIAYLASLISPDVGVITNAYAAHLEGLHSIEGVAKEKGALLQSLQPDAAAIINADDQFADYWKDINAASRVFTFGTDAAADFHYSDLRQTISDHGAALNFSLHTPVGSCPVSLPFAGEHNARNALAAAAAAHAMGVSLESIQTGLANANGIAGRMQIHLAACGARIIDDSYNSNPASARAALHFLAEQNEPGWLVLGDMGELGSNAPDMHASIGRLAAKLGVQRLYAVGKLSRAAVAAFGDEGRWFDSTEDLEDALQKELHAGTNVLIKASRAMHLEHVVDTLKKSPGNSPNKRVGSC